jgi:hypothetical protein
MAAPKGNQYGVGGPGNPNAGQTKYDPKYVVIARQAAENGMTNYEIAELLEVGEPTIYVWMVKHKAFAEALKAGREPADDRVERSLYHRATGYTRKRYIKVKDKETGVITEEEIIEHVPPDVTACIFWLKNRRKTIWRDRHDDDGSGGVLRVQVTGGFVKTEENK